MARNFRNLAKNSPGQIEAALYQEAEFDKTEVQRRTPVEHGTLRASEHVEGPFRQGSRTWCYIVAGGPAAPYAVFVHENVHAHHDVGQSKFLESVILEGRTTLAARVARRIDLNKAILP